MGTTSHVRRRLPAVVLAALLGMYANFAMPVVARAAPAPASLTLPFAAGSDGGMSIRKFMSGLHSRERVVQLSVAVMCLALFILCKKLSEDRL